MAAANVGMKAATTIGSRHHRTSVTERRVRTRALVKPPQVAHAESATDAAKPIPTPMPSAAAFVTFLSYRSGRSSELAQGGHPADAANYPRWGLLTRSAMDEPEDLSPSQTTDRSILGRRSLLREVSQRYGEARDPRRCAVGVSPGSAIRTPYKQGVGDSSPSPPIREPRVRPGRGLLSDPGTDEE